jgi:hypothetical protein
MLNKLPQFRARYFNAAFFRAATARDPVCSGLAWKLHFDHRPKHMADREHTRRLKARSIG